MPKLEIRNYKNKQTDQSRTQEDQMKLEVQKDLDLSQIRLSQANSFLSQSRGQNRKKISQKCQENKRRESQKLKQLTEKLKVKEMNQHFIDKLKMLVPHRSIPNELLAFRKQPTNLFGLLLLKLQKQQGLKIEPHFHLIWKFIILVKVIVLLVASSFFLVFNVNELHRNFFRIIQFSCLVNIIDIVMNFGFQKFQDNKNLKNLRIIAQSYAKNDLTLDLLSLVICIVFKFSHHSAVVAILMVLTLIKLWRSISKIQILEHVYIVNVSHQKYFAILRVFLFNFIIAHFIALSALLMAGISPGNNWITSHQLDQADWLQKYIWAYYWSVNIMLTVGFGDFSATNKHQALVLIFVQTISCIMLAYNINIVGSILTDMKEKQRERKNQLRVLLKMAKQNTIDGQIMEEVVNYVDESFKIKEKYFYEEHDSIIQSLPQTIKSQYRRQTNKKMMFEMPLLYMFSNKSLLKIAEQIVRKLAHPEEIIWKRGEQYRLIILNKGKIGLTHRQVGNSILNGQIIQTLNINANRSKILSVNFFKNQRFMYDIKSMNYSVIYHLSTEEFAWSMAERQTDYQLFCLYRDKQDSWRESGQIYKCNFCKWSRHDYFNCPMIHLVLVKGHIIMKQLKCKKNYKTVRFPYIRQYRCNNFLKLNKILKSQQQSLMNLAEEAQRQTANSILQTLVGGHSEKLAPSIRTNKPVSNIFKEFDIHRLNSLFVAKINEQELCQGFWNLQCDMGYNFNSYFRTNNPDSIKQIGCPRQPSRIMRSASYTYQLN